jgi:hypothetical protein
MNGYKQMRMSIWGQTAYMLASATGIQTSMIFELLCRESYKEQKACHNALYNSDIVIYMEKNS